MNSMEPDRNCSPNNGTTVETKYGFVEGTRKGRSAVFYNIPYAQPPVGALRFAPPQPPLSWAAVLDTCHPEDSPDNPLTVTIHRPDDVEEKSLPILFWLPGGDFIPGAVSNSWHEGHSFNENGIILVTADYRRGFEGFGWVPDSPNNRAVLDLLAALKWVQENIENFGGDPHRVTIAGQGSSGNAILTLLSIEQAQPLFNSAWVSSPIPGVLPLSKSMEATLDLAEHLAIEPTRQNMESLDKAVLIDAQTALAGPQKPGLVTVRQLTGRPLTHMPVVDGNIVKYPPNEAFSTGIGAQKALVIGSNADEFTDVVERARLPLDLLPERALFSTLGMTVQERKEYLLTSEEFSNSGTTQRVDRYVTDMIVRSTVLSTLVARSSYVSAQENTWAYSFEWESPVEGGAVHGLDIPFTFNSLQDPAAQAVTGPTPPQELADEMHGAIRSLTETGQVSWPTWQPLTGLVRIFGNDVQPHVLAPTLNIRRQGYKGVETFLELT